MILRLERMIGRLSNWIFKTGAATYGGLILLGWGLARLTPRGMFWTEIAGGAVMLGIILYVNGVAFATAKHTIDLIDAAYNKAD